MFFNPRKMMRGLIVGAFVVTAACGGSSSGTDTGVTGSIGGTSGRLVTADGSPVAGATVAISTSTSASLIRAALRNEAGHSVRLPYLTDADGQTCEDLTDAVTGTIYASDCTDASGNYSLTADEIPCGSSVTFTAKKNDFMVSFTITLSCSDTNSDGEYDSVDLGDTEMSNTCAVSGDDSSSDDSGTDDSTDTGSDDTGTDSGDSTDSTDSGSDTATDSGSDTGTDGEAETLVRSRPAFTVEDGSCDFQAANMAVVTGAYDSIQNVLAKLGFGEVDSNGGLDTSLDYSFDLIDGGGSNSDAAVMTTEDLLSDPEAMAQYDIIFFNCGNSYESLLADPDILSNIQDYVNNGGKLYVTDWSYDFIEQSFPDVMDFYQGTTGDPDTAETIDAAAYGSSGVTTNASVHDETMATWLDSVAVNTGTIEEAEAGTGCYSSFPSESVNGTTGARNEDGTITIADFLAGWVVMDDTYEDSDTFVWLSGDVTADIGLMDKPLTITKDIGDGRVLYSSYHTAESCPTPGFWPQERVLQYLVFEL